MKRIEPSHVTIFRRETCCRDLQGQAVTISLRDYVTTVNILHIKLLQPLAHSLCWPVYPSPTWFDARSVYTLEL